MKILILHPENPPRAPDEIKCFSDVWVYYLVREMRRHFQITVKEVPRQSDDDLVAWYKKLAVDDYDAVLALGLRYFSTVPPEIGRALKNRLYPGFLCQIHDGSRLDNDPVDITFTLKDESEKYMFGSEANRWVRHNSFNAHVGWAADPGLNFPAQDPDDLRILVDHTNYAQNPIDRSDEVLEKIRGFVESEIWKEKFKTVSVRRFDSGRVVDVDLTDLKPVTRYDRTAIPFTEICEEHRKAHVFCVTHPESVGLVVLETAMAGALTVTPKGFIPKDRLDTVRHIEWNHDIDWQKVLKNIDPEASRKMAMANSWESVAKKIGQILSIRKNIRGYWS